MKKCFIRKFEEFKDVFIYNIERWNIDKGYKLVIKRYGVVLSYEKGKEL